MASAQLKVLRDEDLRSRIGVVVGTRPGIVMFSPVIRELARRSADFFVIHSGQHYSYNMDQSFFDDLNLPDPDFKLDAVQSCTLHGEQTGEMLKGMERILLEERPRLVLVGGDANTNLSGALAARKLRIGVGHIESGERSYDWRMPEEHNRVMIDHISDLLFVTNSKGSEALACESVRGRIVESGNPIVDAAQQNLEIAREKSTILNTYGLEPKDYIVLTMHREENVDSLVNLTEALEGMRSVASKTGLEIQFLAHPRTLKRLKEFGLEETASEIPGLQVRPGAGYLDFLSLQAHARLIMTDSGGVQQEACILKVPCVTLRENTEWTETLDVGANMLAGTDPERMLAAAEKMLAATPDWGTPFGDGHSAETIVEESLRFVVA